MYDESNHGTAFGRMLEDGVLHLGNLDLKTLPLAWLDVVSCRRTLQGRAPSNIPLLEHRELETAREAIDRFFTLAKADCVLTSESLGGHE